MVLPGISGPSFSTSRPRIRWGGGRLHAHGHPRDHVGAVPREGGLRDLPHRGVVEVGVVPQPAVGLAEGGGGGGVLSGPTSILRRHLDPPNLHDSVEHITEPEKV